MGFLQYFKKLFWADKRMRTPAPIKKDEPSAPFVEYRRPNDEEWIVRVTYPQPEGKVRLLEFIAMAGITHRPKPVGDFIRGENRRVILQKTTWEGSPAIEVWGQWEELGEEKKAHIGYVPKDELWIHKHDDLEAMIVCIYKPRFSFNPKELKTAGIRLDIWGKKEASTKAKNKKG